MVDVKDNYFFPKLEKNIECSECNASTKFFVFPIR